LARAVAEALERRCHLSATLVRDIDADTAGSLPRYLVAGPGAMYFAANDGVHGTELWRSDGTAGGTTMVADIVPGSTGSSPSQLTVAGGHVFFTTAAGGLWVTDGTAAGTAELSTVTPASSATITAVGNRVFYAATDATAGLELWSSDGTAAGTGRVADIDPGTAGSSPTSLVADGSTLFFLATDGTHGQELWRSDGTAAGTSMVSDVNPGATGGATGSLVVAGGVVYFNGNDGTHGPELWRSNGTAAGTAMVADLVSGTGGSGPTVMSTASGYLYFYDTDASYATKLYVSDGTAAGTAALMAVSTSTGFANDLGNGRAVIGLSTGNYATTGLYVLSGTATPVMLEAGGPSVTYAAAPVNGQLYFASYTPYQLSLWRTDGTAAGTTAITSVVMPTAGIDTTSAGFDLLTWGGAIYTAAAPVVGTRQPVGQELCRIDPAAGTVSAVADINQVAPYGSNPTLFTQVGNVDFFLINSGTLQLWRTDGTTAGTFEVGDTGHSTLGDNNSNASPTSWQAVGVNGSLVFALAGKVYASTGQAGDLRVLGTYQSGSYYVGGLVSDGTRAFYFAEDASYADALYVTDGTTVTQVASVVPPGIPSAQAVGAILNGVLYFANAAAGTTNTELWRSDGTAAGTYQLAELYPGATASYPSGFTTIGNGVYFDANTPDGTARLWRTDGTAAGTAELSSTVTVGAYNTNSAYGPPPPTFVGINGTAYFAGADATGGAELWRTDGTAAGTRRVVDLIPGSTGSYPADLTVFNGEVAFVAETAPNGTYAGDVYLSDGTAAGTVRLTATLAHTLNPSGISSLVTGPSQLTVVGSTLFFFADDGTRGAGLYRSDGTVAGTVRVDDGTIPLTVKNTTYGVGDALTLAPLGTAGVVFAANDGSRGFEPWFAAAGPALSAYAGRGYTVAEGQSVTLDGTGSEAASSADPIVKYEWDLSYSSTAGFQVDASGPTATFTGLDGPATVSVALRVTTASGDTSVDVAPVTVTYVPPVVAVSGAATAQVGVPYTLALSAVTASATEAIAGWRIDWGDGTVDTLTGNPTSATHTYLLPQTRTITAVARDPNGSYSTGGQTVGVLDPTFGTAGQTLDTAGNGADQRLYVFPDGRTLTVGSNGADVTLSRYTATGQVDATFGVGGHLTLDPTGGAATVTGLAGGPGGRVVVVGMTTPTGGGPATWFALAVNEDGQYDSTFGTGGVVVDPVAPTAVVTSVAVGTDGRIVVAGSLDQGTSAGGVNFFAARLMATGAVDATFNGVGWAALAVGSGTQSDVANAVAVGPDGSVILAGVAPDQYGNDKDGLAKLTGAGVPDTTFGTNGIINAGFSSSYAWVSLARAVVIQPDGRIVIVGTAAQSMGNLSSFPTYVAARYTAAGQLDPTFGSGGFTNDYYAYGTLVSVALEPDGHIVAASTSQVVRFTAAGAFDSYFGLPTDILGVGGMQYLSSPAGTFSATGVALTPAGDILVLAHDELGTLLSKYQVERPSLAVTPQPLVSIAGTVFADVNGDGVQTAPTDVGLANASVYIDANGDGTYESGEPITTANAAGAYQFDLLPVGTYTVRLLVPTGAYQSTPAAAAGRTVVLAAGQGVLGQDFGQTVYGSIAGTAFLDVDADGTRGPSDTAMAGVRVYLDANNNGLLDPGETVATTDGSGAYAFAGLKAGTYTVRALLVTGDRQTPPASNGAYTVTLTSGTVTTGRDFGQTPVTATTGGTIAGSVFSDTNGNGYKDTSEVGMPGVVFYLDLDGDGTLDPGEPTATSSSTGAFSFPLVGPGTYRVRELIPSGYTLTAPTTGTSTVAVTAGSTVSASAFADHPPTTAARLSGIVTGTAGAGTNTAAKAFDSNVSTYFDAVTAGTTDSPNWVGLDLGAAYVLTAVGYASRSGYASRMNGGVFQASNTADFSSGVVTLYTVGAGENPSSTVVTTQQIGVTGAYRYVRYLAPVGSYGDVSEVRFTGVRADTIAVAAGLTTHVTAGGTTTSTAHPYSSLTVQAAGTLTVDAGSARQVVEVPAAALQLAGTTGAWTGTLDLTSNDLVVVGGSLATVTDQIRQAFAGGTWIGGGGGITSSAAAASANHLMGLGVIVNTAPGGGPLYTSLDGLPLTATDVLVRYTFYGDTNLDGVVDAADYSRIDAGFIGHLSGWANGDFNHDGVVDGSDYTLMDNAFNVQTGMTTGTVTTATASTVPSAMPAAAATIELATAVAAKVPASTAIGAALPAAARPAAEPVAAASAGRAVEFDLVAPSRSHVSTPREMWPVAAQSNGAEQLRASVRLSAHSRHGVDVSDVDLPSLPASAVPTAVVA
jgi:uncharacterized delta-60 repeat protein